MENFKVLKQTKNLMKILHQEKVEIDAKYIVIH